MDIDQEIVDDVLESILGPSGSISKKNESTSQDLDETKTAVDSMWDGRPPSPITKQSTTEKDHMFALGVLTLASVAVYIVVQCFGRGCFRI